MNIVQDIRQAFRTLRAAPGFTLAVILALGLGIGANIALFTVVNSLLLRPLPYDRAEELVEISAGAGRLPVTGLRQAQSFSGIALFTSSGFSLATPEGPRNIYGTRVSATLFSVLGVRPALGRIFLADEESEHVALLSYEYWRRTSGDPGIIGTLLTINNESYVVVGVLAPDFTLQVRDANIFVPHPLVEGRAIARLRPGVTTAQAAAEVVSVIRAEQRESTYDRRAENVRVLPIGEAFRPNDANTLLLWQAVVGLVLLITCANVGNLMLVRSAARRKEFAIRSAVGAGRIQLLRQLLTEGAILAAAGGALGLVLAGWSLEYLNRNLPANIGRMLRGAEVLAIDWRVLVFALATSALTVMLFGLAPALTAIRIDLMSVLRDASKGGARDRQRFGQLLVATEVAISIVLLVGAGLMIKSLAGLEKAYLGFSPDHVLRAVVDFSPQKYAEPGQRVALFQNLVERVSSLPGVETVGVLAPQFFPFGGPRVRGAIFEIRSKPGGEPRAEVYTANPEYFRSVRIPLLKGRLFTKTDTLDAPPAAIISEIVAKRYWPDGDPLGQEIRLNAANANSPWVTVIGVVGDVRNPVGRDVQPTAYRPIAQEPIAGGILLVRTSTDPSTLTGPLRVRLREVDPTAPEFRIADLEQSVAAYISPQRFSTSLIGLFAAVGLLLAAVGVYGVMRYWVAARVSEIGLRVALGAQRRDVLGLVFRKAAITVAAGVVVGVIVALALHRVVENQLYGVSPTDPAVFVVVPLLMGAVAVLAALLPALWGARVDPIVALRHE